MAANLAAVIATQDAVVLGRRTYTEWAQFWPSSQIQPFATFINGVTKDVATSTSLDRDWANATVVEGRLVEFGGDLKQQRGGDVGVHASISGAGAARRRRCRERANCASPPRATRRGQDATLAAMSSPVLESVLVRPRSACCWSNAPGLPSTWISRVWPQVVNLRCCRQLNLTLASTIPT